MSSTLTKLAFADTVSYETPPVTQRGYRFMSRFVYSEIAEVAGNLSGNFAVKAGVSSANFVCDIYRYFPKSLIDEIPYLPVSFAKGFLDSLCVDRSPGLPPPPTLPFKGGQCNCVRYNLLIRFRKGQSFNVDVYGKIGGARARFIEQGTNYYLGVFEVLCQGGYPGVCYDTQRWLQVGSSPGADITNDIYIEQVTRPDGLPDNCGDVPVEYPDIPIPDDRKSGNITIQYNDGLDITVPISLTPPSPNSLLTVNVGDIKLDFDFGGVTINDVPDISSDNLTEILQRLDKVDITLSDITQDIDDVREGNKKIQQDVDKPPPEPNSEDYDEDIRDESDDKEEQDIENLSYVKIELINIPKNAKTQSGNDSPDIFYAGWFEFRTGIYAYPREPIHFQSNIFEAPSGANGYAYTLYKGYTGRAIVIKQKEPE